MKPIKNEFENWETGELDLVLVAARAAVELDAVSRGITADTPAFTTLVAFLEELATSSAGKTMNVVPPQLALAIGDAVRTGNLVGPGGQRVEDAVKQAAQITRAFQPSKPSADDVLSKLKTFCVELSKAAMSPVPNGSVDEFVHSMG